MTHRVSHIESAAGECQQIRGMVTRPVTSVKLPKSDTPVPFMKSVCVVMRNRRE